MVRSQKKVEPVPDDDDRSRLKKLAISRNLLSRTPSRPQSTLSATKTVLKHDGRDIVKKYQRKNKFLFSFPGHIGPMSGGKIGELKDLGTKNPILYLDFPQGQMKLFGTIAFPKNRYLTLQFSKGGKNVICEDQFDNMIVFSDAWWIGQKDENPGELRLDFPKHLTEEKHTDCDFKGGAGSTIEQKRGPTKPEKVKDETQLPEDLKDDLSGDSGSPEVHLEDDLSEEFSPLTAKDKDLMEVTPVRHSARTVGKTFKFADASSGDNSVESESDASELMERRVRKKLYDMTDDSGDAINGVDVAAMTDSLEKNKKSPFTVKSKEVSVRNRGSLVQATLSSMFEKVEEKKSTGNARKSSSVKGTPQKAIGSKRKTNPVKDEGPRKKGTPVKAIKSGAKSNKKRKPSQVDDDDIEEFSSESEGIDGSDEDWAA